MGEDLLEEHCMKCFCQTLHTPALQSQAQRPACYWFWTFCRGGRIEILTANTARGDWQSAVRRGILPAGENIIIPILQKGKLRSRMSDS